MAPGCGRMSAWGGTTGGGTQPPSSLPAGSQGLTAQSARSLQARSVSGSVLIGLLSSSAAAEAGTAANLPQSLLCMEGPPPRGRGRTLPVLRDTWSSGPVHWAPGGPSDPRLLCKGTRGVCPAILQLPCVNYSEISLVLQPKEPKSRRAYAALSPWDELVLGSQVGSLQNTRLTPF